MIVSLDEIGPESALDAAVCIIGAGAAGITLACEFENSGFPVLLLEAGGLNLDLAASNELYRGTALAPHPNPSEFRRVVFGGTTGTWGGRCVPFDPIDFDKRDYIAESGWPISYDDVARHYPRALSYCDAGAFDFSAGGSLASPANTLPTLPGLNDNSILMNDRIERYSLPTDFGKRYRARIARSSNVTALLNARCISLARATGENRIASATVVDRAAKRRVVRAQVFVLAMGGIEIPRLLLQSDSEGGPGLGNRFDRLGRYYACHFENILGRLVAPTGKVPFDFEKTLDGAYCRRKLQFTPQAQRQQRLLNTAFRLHFPPYSDAAHGNPALSAIYLAKSSLIPEYRAILQHGSEPALHSPAREHVRNILFGLPALGRFAYQWLFLRNLSSRKLPYTLVKNRDGSYPLEFNCEQTPAASNRITLTDERDRDGLKRARVTWRIGEQDVDAAHRAFLLLRDVLQRHSACRLEFAETDLRQAIARSNPLGGHHIGTARMAATERDGVVDRNCAMFELPNVYIASSATFCTSSHANPTLTIVAFALRLAAHIRAALRNDGLQEVRGDGADHMSITRSTAA
jgi:choline dehydrogenase-like flavoprotein